MPPKTRISLTTGEPFTPEEVVRDLEEREVTVMPKLRRKNKHPGINKDINKTTDNPTIETIWPDS